MFYSESELHLDQLSAADSAVAEVRAPDELTPDRFELAVVMPSAVHITLAQNLYPWPGRISGLSKAAWRRKMKEIAIGFKSSPRKGSDRELDTTRTRTQRTIRLIPRPTETAGVRRQPQTHAIL